MECPEYEGSIERCDYCERRIDRPADPYCNKKNIHAKPDKAQQIVEAIEADLTDRRGLKQEWGQIDYDIQDEIRDTWAGIIRKMLGKEAEELRNVVEILLGECKEHDREYHHVTKLFVIERAEKLLGKGE
jgi:hypothetical protein